MLLINFVKFITLLLCLYFSFPCSHDQIRVKISHTCFYVLITVGIRKIAPPPRKLPPMKLPHYESSPLWKLPPKNCPLWKSPPEKITPYEIPSSPINQKNERKNKITKFLPWRKHNILIKTTKVLFENTRLRYFLYRTKKIPKIERKQKSPNGIYLPVVQAKED